MTTRIKEEEYEKKINITKFNFSCDTIDDTIPRPLPRQSFSLICCGKPQSGKTTLILSLLCKNGRAFNKKFDRVFLFSPSLATMEDNPFELLPDDQKFSEVDVVNLEYVLDDIKDSGEKVLLIFDDVISDIRGKGKGQIENQLQKIFFNRRHLCGAGGSCSIIATAQTYNKIDPKLRRTASHLIFYENKNKKELKTIFDEVILIPEKEFMDTLKYIYDKKHNMMYIDTTLPENKMIHKNFNPLTISSPNIIDFD